jgi:predicted RNA-binding Zn-ribbon protein involved in translation (DUF1610 family)
VSKAIKVAVAGVVFVLAIGLYFARSGETESPTDWKEYNASLRCAECGHDFQAELDPGAVPPFECPKCGAKSAWLLKQCRDCGNVFLPPLVGDPPWPPIIATCPKCKSQATGAVEQKPQ